MFLLFWNFQNKFLRFSRNFQKNFLRFSKFFLRFTKFSKNFFLRFSKFSKKIFQFFLEIFMKVQKKCDFQKKHFLRFKKKVLVFSNFFEIFNFFFWDFHYVFKKHATCCIIFFCIYDERNMFQINYISFYYKITKYYVSRKIYINCYTVYITYTKPNL